MKKELVVNLERFGETGVVVEVVGIDDSERGKGILIENKENLIIKSNKILRHGKRNSVQFGLPRYVAIFW